jgi:hypothetical protein
MVSNNSAFTKERHGCVVANGFTRLVIDDELAILTESAAVHGRRQNAMGAPKLRYQEATLPSDC